MMFCFALQELPARADSLMHSLAAAVATSTASLQEDCQAAGSIEPIADKASPFRPQECQVCQLPPDRLELSIPLELSTPGRLLCLALATLQAILGISRISGTIYQCLCSYGRLRWVMCRSRTSAGASGACCKRGSPMSPTLTSRNTVASA